MQPHERLFSDFFGGKKEIGVTTSSNVASIQYDQDTNVLIIGYLGGSRYAYSNVNPMEAGSLLFAGSKGTWVWDHIRVRGKGNSKKSRKPFAKL